MLRFRVVYKMCDASLRSIASPPDASRRHAKLRYKPRDSRSRRVLWPPHVGASARVHAPGFTPSHGGLGRLAAGRSCLLARSRCAVQHHGGHLRHPRPVGVASAAMASLSLLGRMRLWSRLQRPGIPDSDQEWDSQQCPVLTTHRVWHGVACILPAASVSTHKAFLCVS